MPAWHHRLSQKQQQQGDIEEFSMIDGKKKTDNAKATLFMQLKRVLCIAKTNLHMFQNNSLFNHGIPTDDFQERFSQYANVDSDSRNDLVLRRGFDVPGELSAQDICFRWKRYDCVSIRKFQSNDTNNPIGPKLASAMNQVSAKRSATNWFEHLTGKNKIVFMTLKILESRRIPIYAW